MRANDFPAGYDGNAMRVYVKTSTLMGSLGLYAPRTARTCRVQQEPVEYGKNHGTKHSNQWMAFLKTLG